MLSNMGLAWPFVVSLLLLCTADQAHGDSLKVDLNSADSMRAGAKILAKNLMAYYHGEEYGQTLGILPGPPPEGPYYWWEAGAMWGTMVDYWHYTGDDTYNQLATNAMIWQAGAPQNSFMPPNWTASLGNDDQAFWGMAAMLAAEVNFPNPPEDQPQWLELAQAVFNTQAAPDRHDESCNGGLHWQIPISNGGYNYKNTIANACFFNIGARLARYTDNQTYHDWADRTWDWMEGVGYIADDFNVYDGGNVEKNCTDINKAQFSANAAILIHGAAMMYNYTKAAKWEARVLGLLNQTIEIFFPNGIMIERGCELEDKMICNTDQHSFKGYMHRAMATAAQLYPKAHNPIMSVLKTSTEAAVKNCLPDGTCGFRWTTDSYDGDVDNGPAGQVMSALAAVTTMLLDKQSIGAPVTNSTGGTSKGDPNAGSVPGILSSAPPATTGEKAGAGILTAAILAVTMGALGWMTMDFGEGK
ncbi:glycosyl hydrolase family 76-domain-containing protein [Apodospora peruviana]|uniref:Mannan endo-1,6-alpha-mannosidase n=1 Tax=Apodospora peruviana TaxID=516989 RepID=A0AAE0IBJ6_9PEZI|nr:glycosyl hydrolase family 76-domain-containing protein [Apodospora peruviana]